MLDMGAFLDASWRVYQGQKPYVDFIYYSGPLHLYMNAFFFHLFGFGKSAILAHLIVVHSIIIGSVFLLLQNYLSRGITILLTVLTMASFYWGISHPWHDVSAHFWGVLAILTIVWQLITERKKYLFWIWGLAGFWAFCSFLTKTNLGIAYLMVITLTLLVGFNQHKQAIYGYLMGLGGGILFGLLLIKFPKAYWEQCFLWNQYLIKARLSGFFSPNDWFVNYYWFSFIIVCVIVLLSRSFHHCKQLFVLLAGVTLIGIYAANTGGMIKPANNFLWGIQMSLAFLLLREIKDVIAIDKWKKIYKKLIVGLITFTIFLTVVSFKYGFELKVWTYLLGKAEGDYVLQAEPLKGWKFYYFQGRPLDYLVENIKRKIPATESLLNLTDMYIVNALTGRDGYRGVPFMFLENTIPLPGPEVALVRKNILNNLPDWIVVDLDSLHARLGYLNLYDEILYGYTPAVQWGRYVLIERK